MPQTLLNPLETLRADDTTAALKRPCSEPPRLSVAQQTGETARKTGAAVQDVLQPMTHSLWGLLAAGASA